MYSSLLPPPPPPQVILAQCAVYLAPGPQVRGGLQGLLQREGLPKEPQGTPAVGAAAPAQRLHQAHEGPGLR